MKKKNLLIVLFVSISLSVFAQKKNVQNAIDAMKDDNIEEAIKYIELAASNPSSSDYYKTHDKRGEIYFEVYSNDEYKQFDKMAALKCAESYEALANHPKAKKWFSDDEINTRITNAGVALFNAGVGLHSNGDYKRSLTTLQ